MKHVSSKEEMIFALRVAGVALAAYGALFMIHYWPF